MIMNKYVCLSDLLVATHCWSISQTSTNPFLDLLVALPWTGKKFTFKSIDYIFNQ